MIAAIADRLAASVAALICVPCLPTVFTSWYDAIAALISLAQRSAKRSTRHKTPVLINQRREAGPPSEDPVDSSPSTQLGRVAIPRILKASCQIAFEPFHLNPLTAFHSWITG
jgi:hypothetical protein